MQNLNYLYDQFRRYAQSFYSEDQLIMSGIRLKEDHSIRVAQITKRLTAELKLSERHQQVLRQLACCMIC